MNKGKYVWLLSRSGLEHLGCIGGDLFKDKGGVSFRYNPDRHRIREATPEEIALIESSLAAVEEGRAHRFVTEQVNVTYQREREKGAQRKQENFFLACEELETDDIIVATLRFDVGLYVHVACAVIENFPDERMVRVETYNSRKRTWTPRKRRIGYSSLREICVARRMRDGSIEDADGLPVLPGQLETGRIIPS